MAANGGLRGTLRLVLRGLRGVGWVLATVGLGARALWRMASFVRRLGLLGATVLPCGRGHAVSIYGVWECRCGAVHEGHAFDACRVCGEKGGWIPCSECGLPVVNPWR